MQLYSILSDVAEKCDNFMVRGPSISFLSCFPREDEYLFPPLTYMQPMGEPQELEIDDATFTIVDVKPNMA